MLDNVGVYVLCCAVFPAMFSVLLVSMFFTAQNISLSVIIYFQCFNGLFLLHLFFHASDCLSSSYSVFLCVTEVVIVRPLFLVQ